LDENAALIAHHWEQSGNSLAAARWVHRAARWLTQSHPGEAMELWRKLLRLLDASPSTAEIAFVRARACRWMLWLAASQGMPVEEASDLFDQGRASSEKTRDRRSLALTLANYGYYQSQIQVNPELSLQLTEQAREIADASPNPWLKPTIDIRRTQALTFAGRFPEAIELGFDLLERIADGTAPEIDPLDHVTLHSIVGDALTELGRPRDGIQITTDGLDLATQQDLALNAGHCHITLVRILAALGKGAQTDTHAAAAMRAAERTGNTALMVFAHDATSVAHLINGRPEAAVASSLEALALSRERQVGRISESLHLAHLCLAELQSGDMASAVESGERAVNAIERCGPRFAPRAYLALACALRRRDGIKQQARIETLLGAADDCITATHAELYRPNAAEERAKLLLLSGDKNGARTLLTSAVEGLASLGADASARRVQSLLGQL
jgi:tetratricopeptide (TPR) repeat protein